MLVSSSFSFPSPHWGSSFNTLPAMKAPFSSSCSSLHEFGPQGGSPQRTCQRKTPSTFICFTWVLLHLYSWQPPSAIKLYSPATVCVETGTYSCTWKPLQSAREHATPKRWDDEGWGGMTMRDCSLVWSWKDTNENLNNNLEVFCKHGASVRLRWSTTTAGGVRRTNRRKGSREENTNQATLVSDWKN